MGKRPTIQSTITTHFRRMDSANNKPDNSFTIIDLTAESDDEAVSATASKKKGRKTADRSSSVFGKI